MTGKKKTKKTKNKPKCQSYHEKWQEEDSGDYELVCLTSVTG